MTAGRPTIDMASLVADLAAESASVTSMLAGLDRSAWELPTPAEGWAIRDQISHLAYFDDAVVLAATDPDRFRRDAEVLMRRATDFADAVAKDHRQLDAAELEAWFRSSRGRLLETLGGLGARHRLPWYAVTMSAASAVTARLMETWAHGQDIADALGVRREPTSRLRHIADLGVRTLAFSFSVRGLEPPESPVQVVLEGPDGDTWTWGPSDAGDSVTGSALDFCGVVTQRRNVVDTDLVVAGPVASRWMSVAQAFAGPPTTGRPPGRPGSVSR